MFRIQTLNSISPRGLEIFPRDRYEIASDPIQPDAILLRSFNLNDIEIMPSVKIISRAGIGVNNIPVDICTERGVVVCNTPGANANSVKELVIAGLFLASRRIVDGVNWVRTLNGIGDDVSILIEKEKARFSGPEISGKTLGVIGLGSIGVMVANDAVSLGMEVIGYDPFISIESAWGLSWDIQRAKSMESLLARSDYLTLHVPLTSETRGILDKDKFYMMKNGIRILNFSRGDIIKTEDLKRAINEGIVSTYITDFPDDDILKLPNTIAIPHLGASTPEAEENCAVMAATQVRDFLENGTITNSVNFPDCEMDICGKTRFLICNRNIPSMVGQITNILAKEGINIADMINKSKGLIAYNIIDIDGVISKGNVDKIRSIDGVITVRVLSCLSG
jgi:D-3-phosphoglycerate dehydrogenase